MSRHGLQVVLYVMFFALLTPRTVADGGLLRLAGTAGPYQIALFTEPTPLRVGPVDFGVLVQDATTRQPLHAVTVTIRAEPMATAGSPLCIPLTYGAGRIKLLHHAVANLATSGQWKLTVQVAGEVGRGEADGTVMVGEPLPRWTDHLLWIGLPMVPIGFYVLTQFTRLRANRPS